MRGRNSSRGSSVPGGERLFQRIYTRLGCEGRPPEFQVEFHAYADLTHTIRLREGRAYVRISDALRGAPQKIFEAAAAILLGRLYRRKVAPELLAAYREFSYAASTRLKLLRLRRQRVRRSEQRPAGKHHDLVLLFDQLNRKYFQGALPRPRLGWSRREWRTQLGCFDPALGQIVINRQLDRETVPEFVVAYVLYHEMLHQKHPVRFEHCRRESHSRAFRMEEMKFAEYPRAMNFLERFPAP
jgi:hypothetical protein